MEQVHRHVASQSNNTLPCGEKLAHDIALLDEGSQMAANPFHLSPPISDHDTVRQKVRH